MNELVLTATPSLELESALRPTLWLVVQHMKYSQTKENKREKKLLGRCRFRLTLATNHKEGRRSGGECRRRSVNGTRRAIFREAVVTPNQPLSHTSNHPPRPRTPVLYTHGLLLNMDDMNDELILN